MTNYTPTTTVQDLKAAVAEALGVLAVAAEGEKLKNTLPNPDAPLDLATSVASDLLRAIEAFNGGRYGFDEHVSCALD
ncbi:hypothetical protein [Nodosilinea sp. FACHB-13]|uniref:hypothetical protein n=1 Tax=Cyanophyceae TaxID=3028117 RepID=UPI001684DB36|nr:hypothetical protein [Nodosilinea sp. FACHB-13]MBD2106702.1 hypothetical protein [Nodosilinea sp. FACHB-13]